MLSDILADGIHIGAEYEETNSERVIAMCEEQGLLVDLPEANVLQLDLDTEADYDRFLRVMSCLENNCPDVFSQTTPSRNKEHGRHVRVTLPFDVTPLERIALQAALGSDGVRELLSLVRLVAGDPHPTLLVEKAGFNAAQPLKT